MVTNFFKRLSGLRDVKMVYELRIFADRMGDAEVIRQLIECMTIVGETRMTAFQQRHSEALQNDCECRCWYSL